MSFFQQRVDPEKRKVEGGTSAVYLYAALHANGLCSGAPGGQSHLVLVLLFVVVQSLHPRSSPVHPPTASILPASASSPCFTSSHLPSPSASQHLCLLLCSRSSFFFSISNSIFQSLQFLTFYTPACSNVQRLVQSCWASEPLALAGATLKSVQPL